MLPLVVLLAAALLSLPAGCSAFRLWRRLPRQSVSHLQSERVDDAFSRARRSASAEAREAFALRLISNTLAGAFTGKVEPGELQSAIAPALNSLSSAPVGRLQQASGRMWQLEKAGNPVESWWPSLRVFLEGITRADFDLHQRALIEHWAKAYQSAGLEPGTAYALAHDLFGQPHGPFLQFFVRHLRMVIAERTQAGDAAAAATCSSVLYRLLKQCVLEPGAPGLRLLAANLLADSLDADGDDMMAKQRKELAKDMRTWRSRYRAAARRHTPDVLGVSEIPGIAPAEHARLLHRVALAIWLGSATLTVCVIALLLSWAWIGDRRAGATGGRFVLYGVVVTLLVIGAGWAWMHLWPESVREDLRADFSTMRYWPRLPFAAAGSAVVFTFVGGLLARAASKGQSRLAGRLGAVAAGAWLMLAIVLWGSALAGESARRDYERATRAAYDDVIEATVGPDAERLLEKLREWQP